MLICLNKYSFPCACHRRATTRIGNAKALWTAAVSSPGALAVLEAAGFTGLDALQELYCTLSTHGPPRTPRGKEPLAPQHDGWQGTAFCLCACTFSSPRPFLYSLKPCFASSAFCCEPISFVPECVWLATSILHRRQKVLHKFGVNTARVGKGWVFSSGEHRLQRSRHRTKRSSHTQA